MLTIIGTDKNGRVTSREVETPYGYNGKTEKKEVTRLRAIAERGDPKAQCKLATRYAVGNGIREDTKQAAEWFQRAAEQGYPEGQFWLGAAYYCGQGVPINEACAKRWLKRAVCNGHEGARELLSTIIANRQAMKDMKNEI